jgi:hypothetical protein
VSWYTKKNPTSKIEKHLWNIINLVSVIKQTHTYRRSNHYNALNCSTMTRRFIVRMSKWWCVPPLPPCNYLYEHTPSPANSCVCTLTHPFPLYHCLCFSVFSVFSVFFFCFFTTLNLTFIYVFIYSNTWLAWETIFDLLTHPHIHSLSLSLSQVHECQCSVCVHHWRTQRIKYQQRGVCCKKRDFI